METDELKGLIKTILSFIGEAHCSGYKCRLPHCDCCYDEEYAAEQSEKMYATAKKLKEYIKGD